MNAQHRASHLPHALAALYGLAIAYASLQPFGEWISPVAGTPFWLAAPWPARWTRFDVAANLIAYLPFGIFAALVPRRTSPLMRIGFAALVGAALSFAMESLQMFVPPRDASAIDFVSNTIGAAVGGSAAAALVRMSRTRDWLADARSRMFLGGTIGDVGLALVALWLVAQTNPAIPLFALTFDPDVLRAPLDAGTRDLAGTLIEAASSAFQLVGIGTFIALLVRHRHFAGGVVLILIGTALFAKGVAATLLLKPAVWEGWLHTGILLGVAGGALLLPLAIFLPRAPQVAVCAIALLSSLLMPVLTPDLLLARAPVELFSWRYGQLLNYNGLTHAVLLVWPLLASLWLFALAGRPGWGDPTLAD